MVVSSSRVVKRTCPANLVDLSSCTDRYRVLLPPSLAVGIVYMAVAVVRNLGAVAWRPVS
jgi:hypothetical protein